MVIEGLLLGRASPTARAALSQRNDLHLLLGIGLQHESEPGRSPLRGFQLVLPGQVILVLYDFHPPKTRDCG
jgi:hypothetical protein